MMLRILFDIFFDWVPNALLMLIVGVGIYYFLKRRSLNDQKLDQLITYAAVSFLVFSVLRSLDSVSITLAGAIINTALVGTLGGKIISSRSILFALVILVIDILPAVMIFLERKRHTIRASRWIWVVLALNVANLVMSISYIGLASIGLQFFLISIPRTFAPPLILLLLIRHKLRKTAVSEVKTASSI